MKAQPIEKHISATLLCEECFDLVMTLRSAEREFGDSVPETVVSIRQMFEGAWEALCGEMPQPIGDPINEGDEGGHVTA